MKGIYTLLITLDASATVTIGKRGEVFFPAGHYASVGSALHSLAPRIARHFKKEKALHWHIDYFLQRARVREVIYSLTDKNKECAVASGLAHTLTPVSRFGCSDCRCTSHLYYSKNRNNLKRAVKTGFKKNGLSPQGKITDRFAFQE